MQCERAQELPLRLVRLGRRPAIGSERLQRGHGLAGRFEGRGLVADVAGEPGELELGVGQLQAIFGPRGRIIAKVVAQGAEEGQGRLEQLIT